MKGKSSMEIRKVAAVAGSVLAAATVAGIGGATPALAESSLAGNYDLTWTQSVNKSKIGTTDRVVVTSCGPDCLLVDNLSSPEPGRQYLRVGDTQWAQPIQSIEDYVSGCPDGVKRGADVIWAINADFTEIWSDIKPVDCGDGSGPVKPKSAIGTLARVRGQQTASAV